MFSKIFGGGKTVAPDYAALGKQAAQGDRDALRKILEGAQSGNGDAQLEAGFLYAKGGVVKQSDETAAEWYEKAAANGVLNAQFNLGCMHYLGHGFERSIPNALYWFEMAAKGGHARARDNVPVMREQAKVLAEEQLLYMATGINKVAGFEDKALARRYVARLKELTRSEEVREALMRHDHGVGLPITIGPTVQECIVLIRNISSATPLPVNVILDCAAYDAWEAMDEKLAET